MAHTLAASSLVLLSAVSSSLAAAVPQSAATPAAAKSVAWTSCGTNLQCGSLTVPLDYFGGAAGQATIPLVKYAATGKRVGSLLVNPGGPGASGVNFVTAGGAAFSTLSGGSYDIIGWDTRGNNAASPLLECFSNAGAEYDFASALPSAPNVWSGEFTDSSYNTNITNALTAFDTAVGALSDACVKQNSPALYTSSTSSVIRDMAAIVDAVDGVGAKLNFWGFSYGTVYLAEFIQAFPQRVGRVIADGVVDPTYTNSPTPGAASVGAALDDLAALCEQAGPNGCSFAAAPAGNTKTVRQRIDAIFEDIFQNPIVADGVTVDMSVLAPFLDSFQLVPVTWGTIVSAFAGLEVRDPTALLTILGAVATPPPTNRSAPGTASQAGDILALLDQGPSSESTIANVATFLKSLFIDQKDPIAGASAKQVSLSRHFPAARPVSVARNGTSKMASADVILQKAKTTVLIISSQHDPATPIVQAQKLRGLLPHSSVIASREGPGHTTVSIASLGLAKIVNSFFSTAGAPVLPKDATVVPIDQVVFPPNVTAINGLITPAVYNGTYSAQEQALLDAVYGIDAAFLA